MAKKEEKDGRSKEVKSSEDAQRQQKQASKQECIAKFVKL